MEQAYGDSSEPRNGSLFLFNFGRPPLNRQHRPPESLLRLYLYYILQPLDFLSNDYCHKGSHSHPQGKPIREGCTLGYFVRRDLKSWTNVFWGLMLLSQ